MLTSAEKAEVTMMTVQDVLRSGLSDAGKLKVLDQITRCVDVGRAVRRHEAIQMLSIPPHKPHKPL